MPGNLFIISAPSGAGKTTILKEIMTSVPGLTFSISHTTRAPRKGEMHGRDYFFVDRETFTAMRDDHAFLEWAEVHGNLYGTGKAGVETMLRQGFDIFLDIDVQGARQIKEAGVTNAIFIFIAPPSWEALETRLKGRGTDCSDTIKTRLANARQEMNEAHRYDYLVINDRLADAVDMLKSIILAERCRKRRAVSGEPLDLSSFQSG
jgi:guanylate kinase